MKEKHRFSDNWVIRFGKLFGVPVQAHVSFLFLFGLMVWAIGPINAVLLVACLLAHEFAHVVTGQKLDCETQDVTLLAIGAAAQIKIPDEPRKELKIALAGPVMSLLLAAVFAIGIFVFPAPNLDVVELSSLQAFDPWVTCVVMATINSLIALFNMVPAFPMDGGRVLRAILVMRLKNRVRATKYAWYTACFFAVLGLGWAIYSSNVVLMIVAPFICLAGFAEFQEEEHKAIKRRLSFIYTSATQHLHREDLAEEDKANFEMVRAASESLLSDMEKRRVEQDNKPSKTNFGKQLTIMLVTACSVSFMFHSLFDATNMSGWASSVLNILLTFLLTMLALYSTRSVWTNEVPEK